MTNGLNKTQTKILTWVVYALIFFLTAITARHDVKIDNINNDFVRKDRYESDQAKSENALTRIENKLDRLIMKQARGGGP